MVHLHCIQGAELWPLGSTVTCQDQKACMAFVSNGAHAWACHKLHPFGLPIPSLDCYRIPPASPPYLPVVTEKYHEFLGNMQK